MKNKTGFAQAVINALDNLGDATSLYELTKYTFKLMGWKCSTITFSDVNYACNVRSKWRKTQGKQGNDCRTYKTQTRRNMYDDSSMTPNQFCQFQTLCLEIGTSKIMALANCIHSKDQMVIMANYVQSMSGKIKIRKQA